MEVVKVIFNHGEDYLITRINGSREEIAKYYMNNRFNIDEKMMQVTSIEFMGEVK